MQIFSFCIAFLSVETHSNSVSIVFVCYPLFSFLNFVFLHPLLLSQFREFYLHHFCFCITNYSFKYTECIAKNMFNTYARFSSSSKLLRFQIHCYFVKKKPMGLFYFHQSKKCLSNSEKKKKNQGDDENQRLKREKSKHFLQLKKLPSQYA